MYNRYIPSPDGTFRREIVPDLPINPRPEPITVPYESINEPPQTETNVQGKTNASRQDTPHTIRQTDSQPNVSVARTGAPKKIIPPSLDTGDLLVLLILLLLLVDGDEDDYLSVLLAIAAFILL